VRCAGRACTILLAPDEPQLSFGGKGCFLDRYGLVEKLSGCSIKTRRYEICYFQTVVNIL
jgi:hypothetical protein